MLPAHPSGREKSPVRQYALILPACHEEQTVGPVLDELQATLDPAVYWLVAVGVNGSSPGADRTAALARQHPLRPLVAETPSRGYGYGCQAAIDLLATLGHAPDAYIFFAADGANDPRDLVKLIRAHQAGHDLVLGCRTSLWRTGNRKTMGWSHVLANRLLGAWCAVLTGRWFDDIGPLRLIERRLFQRLRLREWTFGWTVEAQVRAVRLGASTVEVPVHERPRLAGEQGLQGPLAADARHRLPDRSGRLANALALARDAAGTRLRRHGLSGGSRLLRRTGRSALTSHLCSPLRFWLDSSCR